jgi:hypothetical protein
LEHLNRDVGLDVVREERGQLTSGESLDLRDAVLAHASAMSSRTRPRDVGKWSLSSAPPFVTRRVPAGGTPSFYEAFQKDEGAFKVVFKP